jgi:hypothetical protein
MKRIDFQNFHFDLNQTEMYVYIMCVCERASRQKAAM